MDEKERLSLTDELIKDPIIQSASERAKKTEHGAALEHALYGTICFNNEGLIVKVIPQIVVLN